MFPNRMLALMKEKKITKKQISKDLHFGINQIKYWEDNRNTPNASVLSEIAEYLGTNTAYLLEYSDDPSCSANETTKKPPSAPAGQKGVRIPVLGNVAAGIPLEAITDIEDYEEISEAMAAGGEYVALRIHGDSMEPRMTEGDVVIVRVQDTIDSGEVGVFIINGDEATCKRIKKTPDGIMLISNNPSYEPMFFSNQQVQELPVRVFGKVVELRAKFW